MSTMIQEIWQSSVFGTHWSILSKFLPFQYTDYITSHHITMNLPTKPHMLYAVVATFHERHC